ncbi:hypothetical protein [Streptomyces syringium]|uniref:hypothetical protein n=1 Tax=Streptomyces syringium TaxID=76729 RepID=UPI0033CAF7D5
MRTRNRVRFSWLLAVCVAFLCLVQPSVAVADGPDKTQKALEECGKEKYPKKSCIELFRKECRAAEGKVKDTPACKAIADKIVVKKDRSSAGEKLCEGHDNAACDVARGASEATRKVDDTIQHPVEAVASTAFDAVSGKFGTAAQDVLSGLTDAFLKVSVINLDDEGLLNVYGMTWAISSLVALLLLIWQFSKLALSGDGLNAATAITGLAKWAVISIASLAVTQASLGAADELSNWMISHYKDGGGQKAFEESLNNSFAFQNPAMNTALVLLLAIIAALVSLVLWGEMLLRAAAIQVLVACMPIAAAGGIMEATKEWWPKARNAVIALIVMKPVIVLIFVLGFTTTGNSKNLKDLLVGLLTLVLAAVAWPTIAKFMTFTSVGSGGSLASGLLGAIGGTAASMFGYGGGSPSGAGATGGGQAFTRAVESENDGAVAQAGAASRARGGGFAAGLAGMGKLGIAGMALQAAKAGKELTEGSMEAMAAHADLGPGKDMGGQVSIPPRGGEPAAAPPPPPEGPADRSEPPPTVPLESTEPPPAAPPRGEAPADTGAAQPEPVDMSWPAPPATPQPADTSSPAPPAAPQPVDMSWPSAPAPPPQTGPGQSGGTT